MKGNLHSRLTHYTFLLRESKTNELDIFIAIDRFSFDLFIELSFNYDGLLSMSFEAVMSAYQVFMYKNKHQQY